MIYKPKKKKIFVAMSGGVDSSVAAALLKKQGHDVVGIFMRLWTPPASIFGEKCYVTENKCCSGEAEITARKVANQLKIPFYAMDFRKKFKKAVVDYFLKEHAAGRTPNPCIICNQKIKFDFLLKRVLGLGADYLATGHYVKKQKAKSEKRKTIYQLFQAKDKKKDQSYFLWTLTQRQLKHLLFPLGDYTKDEVREMARDFELPICFKESFDICFVPRFRPAFAEATAGKQGFGGQAAKNHNDFLKKYLRLKPGEIVTANGKKVGIHQGLPLYTIGQRREIGIGGVGPFYVIERDYKKNRLIVTSNLNDQRLFRKELVAEKINWILNKEPAIERVRAKIRYGQKAENAIFEKVKKTEYRFIFQKPQRAVAPGQSIVFYKNKELLGGGIIL